MSRRLTQPPRSSLSTDVHLAKSTSDSHTTGRHLRNTHSPIAHKMVESLDISSDVVVVEQEYEPEGSQDATELVDFEAYPGAPCSGSGCVIV